MDSRKALKLAEITLKIAFAFPVALFVFHLFVFIHSAYSPDTYDKLLVKKVYVGYDFSYRPQILEQAKTTEEYKKANLDGYYYYNKLRLNIKTKILAYYAFGLVMSILGFKYLSNFIRNAKNYSSFFITSSNFLRKLAYLLLVNSIVLFLFSIFGGRMEMLLSDFYSHIESESYYFNIGLILRGIGGFALCMFLSNVFKEGERLRRENELTI